MTRRSFLLTSPALAGIATFSVPQPRNSGSFDLGTVTYNLFKDASLEALIPAVEAAGWAAVELRTGHKHGVEPSLAPGERARVRRIFDRSKVRLVGYGTTCRFQSPDAAERKQQLEIARQFVDLAADTGALGIKIQPMGLPPEVPRETSIRNFGETLSQLGEYGANRGVEIWMEVHGRVTSDPPVAAAIVKAAANSNVGVCWNSNPTDVASGSVQAAFELLKPWIRNVHIHELVDESYPYAELFALLRKANYRRYTLAEVPESKEPERYMRYYKSLWAELTRPSAGGSR